MIRHFTVTTFVSAQGATLLHWHARNRMWLPPGGHIEPDEDPVEAALREVQEETGLTVEILPTAPAFAYAEPSQIPAPVTIMVEPIPASDGEPAHAHLDLIYFARPGAAGRPPAPTGWLWVSAEDLAANRHLLPPGAARPTEIPADVRVLGVAAIERATAARPTSGLPLRSPAAR